MTKLSHKKRQALSDVQRIELIALAERMRPQLETLAEKHRKLHDEMIMRIKK